MDAVVICCAINGAVPRDRCSFVPIDADEIAKEAGRARDAGAAVVHFHARDPGASADPQLYQDALAAIRFTAPELIVNVAGRPGVAGVEERVKHLAPAAPEIASVFAGAAMWTDPEVLIANSVAEIGETLPLIEQHGSIPEFECFDPTHVATAATLQRERQSILIRLGIPGTVPGNQAALTYAVSLVPNGVFWHAAGHGDASWHIVDAAIRMGGHIRVGVEDHHLLPDRRAASSNAELVEQSVRMARDAGRAPASPAQARELLGL